MVCGEHYDSLEDYDAHRGAHGDDRPVQRGAYDERRTERAAWQQVLAEHGRREPQRPQGFPDVRGSKR